MYLKEIETIKASPFIKENIKNKFVEVLSWKNKNDSRIKNILDIVLLVQEKQDFFERELEKIRDNMTNKINEYIKELPSKKELLKNIEKNEMEEESMKSINDIENLINNKI